MTTTQAPLGYMSPGAWHNKWRSQQLGRSIIVGKTFGKFSTMQAGITNAVAMGAVSAATRTTVFVGPGIYVEAPTMAPFVDVVSLYGPEQTVIRQANATIATLASNSKLRGFTLDLNLPTAARNMIVDGGVAVTACVLEDCIISITTPGGFASRVVLLSAASNMTLLRCRGTITDGANPGIQILRNDTAGATLLVEQCDFTLNDTAGFVVFSNVAGTWTLRGNALSGTAGGYSVSLGTVRGFGNNITTTAAHAVTGGSVTEKSGRQRYDVYVGMLIQHAITAATADTPAPAAAAPYDVFINSGVYVEAITGSAFVSLRAVQIGAVTIRQADATVLTLGASNYWVEGIVFDLNAPIAARNMVVEGGVPTARTGIVFTRCRFTITTPGGFTHRVFLIQAASDIGLHNVHCSITDGANPAIHMIRNDAVGATFHLLECWLDLNTTAGFIIFSNVAGTWTLRQNSLSGSAGGYSVSAGNLRGYNNVITTTAAHAVTGGSVIEKSGKQQYEVYAGMVIAHAIAAAAADVPAPAVGAPYIVQIHPGVYAESNLALAASVHLVGLNADSCRIIAADAANPIVACAVSGTIANLTIGNTNAGAPAVRVTGGALTMRRCVLYGTGGGDCIAMTAGLMDIYDTTVGVGDIDLSTAPCILQMFRCRLTSDPIDTAGAFAHNLHLENCDFGGQSLVSAATGATTLDMFNCTYIAVISNAGTGVFVIRESDVATVTATVGVIRLRGTQYRSAIRTGAGVVIDESLGPAAAALRVVHRLWELAIIANQNIATRLAIGGAVLSGGTGQTRLRINDNAADAAGTEQAADAAGSLASTWTPARGIRYVMPVSVANFRATTSMFFGVRGVLGVAVPAAAEHHAGFIWTGAAFNASSSNGGGVGQVSALATPSTGVHHILEVIVVGAVQVEFYVDGALVATHATAAGVPTAAQYFQEYEISTGAGGATTSDITLREGFLQECTA